MSFSRAKIARINPKDAAAKESDTSNSKSTTKPKTEKWAPKSLRGPPPKLPRPVRQRSISQPSSSTTLNARPRPRSVDNNHVTDADSSKVDLEKTDEDGDFHSTTILHIPEQLTKIEEDSKSGNINVLEPTSSETKSNTSGIPLRIKISQSNYKESYKSPRDNKKLTSTSHVSTISSASTPKKEVRTAASSTLLVQFETKKKRLLVLKEELNAKQQLVSDSYKILVELKKKLDRSGFNNAVLEDLNIQQAREVDPSLAECMKKTLNEIPKSLKDLCKSLMTKRKLLVDVLDSFTQNKITTEEVESHLKIYKEETFDLEKELLCSCEGQQSLINQLMQKWSILSSNSGDASNIAQQVEELQGKLKEQECKLESVTKHLQQALEQSELYERKTNHAEATVNQLKEKIKNLEHDLATERNASQSHRDKFSANDQKVKGMKTKIQDLENKCKDAENKFNELQKSCKHTQDQVKLNEQKWLKEKEELMTKNKHDKLLLDKITKDRSCFETRTKSAETKLKEELEETKKLLVEEKNRRESMQEKYDLINSELVELEIRNKQTVDIVNTKHTYEPREVENISTEREVELYTELLATRVGLKAAEEKLQSYNREKMRFLDTIQLLQGDHNESLISLQNMQKLTEMEEAVSEKDEIIYKQKMEITNLIYEIEQMKLKEKSQALDKEETIEEESELKVMLREGKTKIEQLIKKSSENEQKAISYKHDLDKRSKQLCEMENLLKAREELLTVMKIKKDELQIENSSLNKYANEIRELLIQSREEARNRNELVQELTMNLETKGRACEQLEKMIRELEYSLSITNEKRFKLQESIGAMEKELQSTKAHIINMTPEGKNNRYGIINASRKVSRLKSPRTRHTFTFTQNSANVSATDLYSYSTHPNKSLTSMRHPINPFKDYLRLPESSPKKMPSDSSCDSQSSNLDTNAIRSWLSSYENIEDIQKRLKFLKRAFNTLSKKMMVQDIKLKESPLKHYDIPNHAISSDKLQNTLPSASKVFIRSLDPSLHQNKYFSSISTSHPNVDKHWTYTENLAPNPNANKNLDNRPTVLKSCLKRPSSTNRLHNNVNSSLTPPKILPFKHNLPCTKNMQQLSSLDSIRDRCFEQRIISRKPPKYLETNSGSSSASSLEPFLPQSILKPTKPYVASSIPVPKPRYSPLTLPTRTLPLTSALPVSMQQLDSNSLEKPSFKRYSQIPISKQIWPCSNNNLSGNFLKPEVQTNYHNSLYMRQSKSDKYIEEYLNSQEINTDKCCPSRSYLLYTNSNISTYNNTKKHLQQIKTLTKGTGKNKSNAHQINYNTRSASQSSTSSENPINTPSAKTKPETTTLCPYSNHSTIESSSDSGQSNVSISTVIKCSHLFNNLSKNCSDLLISKKQYVLKLFTQSVHSESDVTDRRDFAIHKEVDNNVFPSITIAQSLNHMMRLPSGLE